MQLELTRVMALAFVLTIACAKVVAPPNAAPGDAGVDGRGLAPPFWTGGASGGSGGSAGTSGGGSTTCKNLQCQQVPCAGATTTVSGTVYAPNGMLPLYNVRVYVPNAPLPPAVAGVTCDQCAGIKGTVSVVASALTDAHGAFKLENVPAGKNIPLVMQVGKWR